MSLINYRKLHSHDAEAFRNLRIEATRTSPESIHPSTEELSGLDVSEFSKQVHPSELQSVYGAYIDDALVAIAGIRRDPLKKIRHKAMIWGVYTQESCRGRGIARALMRVLLEDAKSNPEITMICLSVHSRNVAAKALYESLGFSTCGMQRNAMVVNGQYVDEEYMDFYVIKGEPSSSA